MSDLLTEPPNEREPLQASFSDAANPLGLDGVEFIEYATPKPQALGQVLEMMGFRPVARHRSREVLLYRQGHLNVVLNANPTDVSGAGHGSQAPSISAIALRVRDARAAYRYALERGAWEVPTHAEVMELNIPAICTITKWTSPSRCCRCAPRWAARCCWPARPPRNTPVKTWTTSRVTCANWPCWRCRWASGSRTKV